MSDRRPTFNARIQLLRNRVHYQIEDRLVEFAVQDIQLIGEYTAPPGLLAADYFFSVKLRARELPIDIPAYAEGLLETLEELRQLLPGIGRPKLQMSTDFDSHVLYPAHVAGMAMFKFRQESKPLFDVPLLRSMGSVQKVVKEIQPEVLAAVF
jgi:hypothetical protein